MQIEYGVEWRCAGCKKLLGIFLAPPYGSIKCSRCNRVNVNTPRDITACYTSEQHPESPRAPTPVGPSHERQR